MAIVALAAFVIVGCSAGSGSETEAAQTDVTTTPAAGAAEARSAARKLRLRRVGNFNQPVYVDDAPGQKGLLFVVEQGGRVMVVKKGRKVGRPFLDISDRVLSGGEEGLLSIAFDRDYKKNRRLYAYYTDSASNNRVVMFRRSKGTRLRARKGSARNVIRLSHPGASNHNGGQLQIDRRNHLWIGTGDGGSSGDRFDNARKTTTLLGKLLRIKPKGSGGYRAPNGNPFVGRPGASEVYAIGLRNPWRFSFDRKRPERMTIGDVGQSTREEINYFKVGKARGANFEWPTREGTEPFDPDRTGPGKRIGPIHDYARSGGNCSVTGGYVVRDPKLPSLAGRYVYADFCKGEIRSLRPRLSGARGDRSEGLSPGQITSFGEGRKGKIYIATAGGPVFRLKQG